MATKKYSSVKKREKRSLENEEDSNSNSNGVATDPNRELFLQVFNKPTQIYRYLSSIHSESTPIFLQRNLTYNKSRRTGKKSTWKTFKVDSMLDKCFPSVAASNKYLTLTFLGIENWTKLVNDNDRFASIEVFIVRRPLGAQTDSSSMQRESIGVLNIPVNSSNETSCSKVPSLSIKSGLFSNVGNQFKFHSILIKIDSRNGDNSRHHTNEATGQNSIQNGDLKSNGSSKRSFYCELKSPKQNLQEIDDGDYELLMFEMMHSSKKNLAWLTLPPEDSAKLKSFDQDLFLLANVAWTKEPASSMVERPRSLMPRSATQNKSQANQSTSNSSQSEAKKKDKHHSKAEENHHRVIIKFFHLGKLQEITEVSPDLTCPWCYLHCGELYPLLKHFKLSHPRFMCTFHHGDNCTKVDVTISELFDTTYAGDPQNLVQQPPLSQQSPSQRLSNTNTLVWKPKRPKPSLKEFLETEENDLNGPYDGQKPFITGHNRLYYHSTTNMPLPAHAILYETTEDQIDPDWLIIKMSKMIDDFTDVNEGEKSMMKMWNIHMQHHNFVGDVQLPLALKLFLEENGETIARQNLYKNFLLHVMCLYTLKCLSHVDVINTVYQLHTIFVDKKINVYDRWIDQNKRLRTNSGSAVRKNFSGIFKTEPETE